MPICGSGLEKSYFQRALSTLTRGKDKEELEKQIKEFEEKLKDREDALPAHSVKHQKMLIIDELETEIEKKKNELAGLRKGKSNS